MGLVDAISAEDRVSVKFSDFYNLIKCASKYEITVNGLKNDVPHEYMRAMLGIKTEKSEVKE